MWMVLAKVVYMGMGLMLMMGILTCVYLDLREFIYHDLFKKNFGMDFIPKHIRIRITDMEDALRNEYYIHMNGSQSIPIFDCVMYVSGWKLTTGWANDMLFMVRMLEEKGISFSDGSQNESLDISDRKSKLCSMEKQLNCLFVLIGVLCAIGYLYFLFCYQKG